MSFELLEKLGFKSPNKMTKEELKEFEFIGKYQDQFIIDRIGIPLEELEIMDIPLPLLQFVAKRIHNEWCTYIKSKWIDGIIFKEDINPMDKYEEEWEEKYYANCK